MDFNYDEKTLNIGNQYMFGPFIMAVPVTEEQYYKIEVKKDNKSKEEPETNTENAENVLKVIESYDPSNKSIPVYLPIGTDWYDFWTGEKFKGGQTISKETPIDIMPIYIRAGSIIPFGPFKQFSTEKPEDPIEIRIYPGEDAEFILYEDENDNYNYEKGIYLEIPLQWIENSRTLIFGERKGEFPGMLKERTFNVVIVSEGHGCGVEICDTIDLSIRYDGSEQGVSGS
jgi:alpha-D-xyloside xylohydrolase